MEQRQRAVIVLVGYTNAGKSTPYEKGNILSYFKDNANIKSTECNINGVLISVECKESDYRKYVTFLS